MKKTILPFVLILFLPIFSLSQKQVTEKEIQEIFTLVQKGKKAKALEMISDLRETATVKDSLYAMLIMARLEILRDKLDYEEALKDNEELIKLVPSFERDCLWHIARYKKYLGDYEGAIQAYRRIQEIDTKDTYLYHNLASVYNLSGKYNEAIITLNSNQNSERLSLDFYSYAFSYLKLNKFDSAKYYIDKFTATDSVNDNSSAYKAAAEIYAALSDTAKACEYISDANRIIKKGKYLKYISKESQKIQNYPYIKFLKTELEEIPKLKARYCLKLAN